MSSFTIQYESSEYGFHESSVFMYESEDGQVIPFSGQGYTMRHLLRQILEDVPELTQENDVCCQLERIIFYDRDFRRIDGYGSDDQTVEELFPDLYCRVMIVNENLTGLVVRAHKFQGTATWPWVMDEEMEAFFEEEAEMARRYEEMERLEEEDAFRARTSEE